MYKASTILVQHHALIVVGDLSAKKIVKTKMAKSVVDTGFAVLKTMRKYKCQSKRVVFKEVNQTYNPNLCNRLDSSIKYTQA